MRLHVELQTRVPDGTITHQHECNIVPSRFAEGAMLVHLVPDQSRKFGGAAFPISNEDWHRMQDHGQAVTVLHQGLVWMLRLVPQPQEGV